MLQALDEEYLGCDVQFGGIDQRKIFMFARTWMPKLGYKKRAYIMNSLIPGLSESGKMSSSEPLSKIELHESEEALKSKLANAFMGGKKTAEGNGVLAIICHILFPFLNARDEHGYFDCSGKRFYAYVDLENAFNDGTVLNDELTSACADLLIQLLHPLRVFWCKNKDLYDMAYSTGC